ncbi:MAG: hypothetical protein ACLRMN_04870 [Mediterraneibacter gnavus]
MYLGGACLLILVGVYEYASPDSAFLCRFARQNLRHKYKEENLFFLGARLGGASILLAGQWLWWRFF